MNTLPKPLLSDIYTVLNRLCANEISKDEAFERIEMAVGLYTGKQINKCLRGELEETTNV